MLIGCYNEHIEKYVRNLIELTYVIGLPPNEIIATIIQPSGNPGMPGIERKIKAKDSQMQTKPIMEKEKSILKVIRKLIDEEDKKATKFD